MDATDRPSENRVVREPTSERVWRVFYTRARAEKKCEDRLHDRRIEVLLPKRKVVRQWSDRKKEVIEPLFRNYIFAQVDEKDRLRVLQTPGIVRCVHFNGTPARLRETEVEQIQRTQKTPDRLSVVDLRPPVGETVTITEGPLQGLSGEVREHRGQTYVLVRVETIRQAVKVQVPADWVETGGDPGRQAA
jgi:transcription antitermination factor NusG